MVDTASLPAEVRALIAAQAARIARQDDQLNDHRVLIEKLRLQIARWRRAQFGPSSERLDAELAQLTLALEELEVGEGERRQDRAHDAPPSEETPQKPARRPLPEHLPRVVVEHAAACACPHCGGELRRFGEDVTEVLDYVPASFRVVRHVRAKLSCRACEAVVQAPAPDLPIRRDRATASLLAHVLVAKCADHLPLYRQSESHAREGVELERSRSPTGSGSPRRCCGRWWARSRGTSWTATGSTPTTRPSRCSRQERARPRPAAFGPTSRRAAARRPGAAG